MCLGSVSGHHRPRPRLRVAAERPQGYEAAAGGTGGGEGPARPSRAHGTGQGVDPAVALAALRHAADLLARADLERLTDRGLLAHTVAVDRQVTRLEAARLARLSAVDRRAAFTAEACVTAGSWFRTRTRRDPAGGARLARWARRLERFRLLGAALAAGEITLDHVRVVVRAASTGPRRTGLVDHEETLVALARRATPADLDVAVTRICEAVDHREAEPGGPAAARGLYHARIIDGLGDLRATLDPATAERLETLLDAYRRPDPADTDPPRSPAQIRHDAFDAILRAAEEHPRAPRVQGARPHLVVFADLFTILGRPDLASRPTTRLGSGRPVDLARVAHLLEEAGATGVLGLGPFRPVAFGRTRRVLPDWLRPALAMVHATCRGPGCDRPAAWTQAMHLGGAWAAGATTELDTTAPGCHAHHRLVDVVGWRVDLDPDTAVATWVSPDRRTTVVTRPPDP